MPTAYIGRLSQGSDIGGGLFAEEAVVTGGDGKRELYLLFGRALDERTRLNAHVLFGFSDASPDYGAGLGLTFNLR